MTRMEIRRKTEPGLSDAWLSTDRKDYISFHRVIGFIAGTAFYGVVAVAVASVLLTVVVSNLDRSLMLLFLLGGVIGYLIFMFFYQRWYYEFANRRYKEAKIGAIRWRRDWDDLSRIYEEEDEAARPTVNMDLLFPEGSLGENE